jgi:hypothetical protein
LRRNVRKKSVFAGEKLISANLRIATAECNMGTDTCQCDATAINDWLPYRGGTGTNTDAGACPDVCVQLARVHAPFGGPNQ